MLDLTQIVGEQRQGAEQEAGDVVLHVAGLQAAPDELKPRAVAATPLTAPSITQGSKKRAKNAEQAVNGRTNTES